MKFEFTRLVNANVQVKADVIKNREHFPNVDVAVGDIKKQIIKGIDALNFLLDDTHGIYERYTASWYNYFNS